MREGGKVCLLSLLNTRIIPVVSAFMMSHSESWLGREDSVKEMAFKMSEYQKHIVQYDSVKTLKGNSGVF